MSEDIKPEVIKKTQDTLGKYIKRPPLTEKLLRKPPFRFLHDIITNVIRETGFLQGIFTPEELNHENIKDREGKIVFLQKSIDAVKSITGIQLAARPSKIVAGHEPSKTNEFLQAIAKALDKKENSKSKSKSTLQSKSHSRDKSKKDVTKKKSSSNTAIPNEKHIKSSGDAAEQEDVTKSDEKATEDKNIILSAEENAETKIASENVSHNDLPPEDSIKEYPSELKVSQQLSEEVGYSQTGATGEDITQSHVSQPLEEKISREEIIEEGAGEPPQDEPPSKKSSHEKKKKSKIRSAHVDATKDDDDVHNLRKEADTPAEIGIFGSKTANSEMVADVPTIQRVTSSRPRTARPASARPAAPRIRDRGEVIIQEDPKPVIGKVNVITVDDTSKEQDDFDNFVVVEAPSVTSLTQQDANATQVTVQPGEEGKHGHLVAQILETQKELEDDSQFSSVSQTQKVKRVEIEWEAGQRREKEMASKEVDRLRASIQTLTRAANPLGKLMDFLQEDVDAMQRELESWRTTNRQLKVQLVEEQSLTEDSIKPMKIHLEQLQNNILEKLDEISASKAAILRNELKIQHLLSGGLQEKTEKIT